MVNQYGTLRYCQQKKPEHILQCCQTLGLSEVTLFISFRLGHVDTAWAFSPEDVDALLERGEVVDLAGSCHSKSPSEWFGVLDVKVISRLTHASRVCLCHPHTIESRGFYVGPTWCSFYCALVCFPRSSSHSTDFTRRWRDATTLFIEAHCFLWQVFCGWLPACLAGWLVGWLVSWLVGWLGGRMPSIPGYLGSGLRIGQSCSGSTGCIPSITGLTHTRAACWL